MTTSKSTAALLAFTLACVASVAGNNVTNYKNSAAAFAAAEAARARVTEGDKCIADVHKRNDANNAARREDADKIVKLYEEKKKSIEDMRNGRYCSKCTRTATEIEKVESTSFAAHLKKVSGREVPAPANKIREKAKEYDQKIKELQDKLKKNDTFRKLFIEYAGCVSKRDSSYSDHQYALSQANYLKWHEDAVKHLEQLGKDRAERAEKEKRADAAREKFVAEIRAADKAEEQRRLKQRDLEEMKKLGRMDRDYEREKAEQMRQIEKQLEGLREQERQAQARREAARKGYEATQDYPTRKKEEPASQPSPPSATPLPRPTDALDALADSLKQKLDQDRQLTDEAVSRSDNIYNDLRRRGEDVGWEMITIGGDGRPDPVPSVITFPGPSRPNTRGGTRSTPQNDGGDRAGADDDTGDAKTSPQPSASPTAPKNRRPVIVTGTGQGADPTEASTRALADCLRQGGSPCQSFYACGGNGLYGAIAIAPLSEAVGYSYWAKTQAAADQEALNRCHSQLGGPCFILRRVSDKCVGVARGRK
ncbi:MAG: DUF4189 domain-containing protein [Acidobacteria bacterium]|nr:DUF4189 domain-containing protein [Acidobacteriota bacterium]